MRNYVPLARPALFPRLASPARGTTVACATSCHSLAPPYSSRIKHQSTTHNEKKRMRKNCTIHSPPTPLASSLPGELRSPLKGSFPTVTSVVPFGKARHSVASGKLPPFGRAGRKLRSRAPPLSTPRPAHHYPLPFLFVCPDSGR